MFHPGLPPYWMPQLLSGSKTYGNISTSSSHRNPLDSTYMRDSMGVGGPARYLKDALWARTVCCWIMQRTPKVSGKKYLPWEPTWNLHS